MKNLSFIFVAWTLVIAGSMISTALGDSSLRWATPKVQDSSVSATQAKLRAAQQRSLGASPIRQVSWNDDSGQLPIPQPSVPEAARIDTQYPETRPGAKGTTPLVAPTTSPPIGSFTEPQPGPVDPELDITVDNAGGVSSARPERVIITCPKTGALKSIKDFDFDIRLKSAGEVPKECGFGEEYFQGRNWQRTCFFWKASALCHKPLYFEEEALERYGHTYVREEFQPIVSGLHFFLSVPLLPYKMGLNPPNECIYTLGYYRPGDCAPYILDPLPLSVRAGLFEAAAVVGGVAIFP